MIALRQNKYAASIVLMAVLSVALLVLSLSDVKTQQNVSFPLRENNTRHKSSEVRRTAAKANEESSLSTKTQQSTILWQRPDTALYTNDKICFL